MTTYGLIPAAGKSRRMGRAKLLLSIGECTVLERVIGAVRQGGVREVVVVTAPDGDEIARLAELAGAHAVRLPEDTPDMRATVMHGLKWIEDRFDPTDEGGWLLLPADHPTVRPDIVAALLSAAHKDSIVVPTFEGRRGHPTWLAWSLVGAFSAFTPDQGINAFIRANADRTRELAWSDAEILRDLDTPEDYQALAAAITAPAKVP